MRDVATAFVAARFASPLARLAVVPVLLAGRALDFSSDQMLLRIDPRGLVIGVHLTSATLGDSGGPTPAHVAAARRAVDAYRPVVDGLREVGALGTRALWGQLADALVSVLGQQFGAALDPQTASVVADRWLRAGHPPLWVETAFSRSDGGRLAWRRGSCCLAYRLEHFDLCDGCPLQARRR